MTRDEREPLHRLGLKLPQSEWELLRRQADEEGRTITMTIRRLIASHCNAPPPVAHQGRPRNLGTPVT